jgi:hypothetical protein
MSKVKNVRWSGISVRFLAVFCALSLSIFSSTYLFAWTCIGTAPQCAQYLEAINDAQTDLTPDKIYDGLTRIVPENPNLIWKDGVIGSKLLVAAYKYGTPDNPPFSTCQPGVTFPKDCPVTGSPWVTVVPELADFFNKHAFTTLRIEQLLGLPPNYGNNYIVEYWADPKDLFRPAPDPQIVYQEGSVQFPWEASRLLSSATPDDYKVWDDYCTVSTDASCQCLAGSQYMDYKCWFQNRRTYVYSYDYSSAPYPWTGLGFTYDWGNSRTHVGLSEFVLNKAPIYSPFTVTIQSVTVAADYMKRRQRSTLTVEKPGLGKGTITSIPHGINCGPNCDGTSRTFEKYENVTLTAKVRKDSVFTGWTGACSGSSLSCMVPMVSDLTVQAHFAPAP